MSFTVRRIPLALLLLALFPFRVLGDSPELSFADGRIRCVITSAQPTLPADFLPAISIAMNVALEYIGAPSEPARLTIRLQPPPTFTQRFTEWFRREAAARQQADEVQVREDADPLKLTFRLAHELSHWLVSRRYSVRPPLWLDEGLAQRIGAEAADTCARTRKQTLDRPRPPALDRNLHSVNELTALQAYPQSEARAAAFYWQAEAMVNALHRKLGAADFTAYLGLLSSPGAPPWQQPLRERWYFSDWDFHWLEQQIRPASGSNPEADGRN